MRFSKRAKLLLATALSEQFGHSVEEALENLKPNEIYDWQKASLTAIDRALAGSTPNA